MMERKALVPLPGWVVPARSEVSDLEWLAYRLWWFDGEDDRPAGVYAAAAWVGGAAPGRAPVTGVEGQPVSREMAWAELARASSVCEIARRVPGREGLAQWAGGIRSALGWLLGMPGVGPPYPVPVRHPEPDWRTLSARELYDRAITADPDRYRSEVEQDGLWLAAQRDARFYADLAVLIEDTLRRAAAQA